MLRSVKFDGLGADNSAYSPSSLPVSGSSAFGSDVTFLLLISTAATAAAIIAVQRTAAPIPTPIHRSIINTIICHREAAFTGAHSAKMQSGNK